MSGFADDSLPSGGSNYLSFENSPAAAASLFSKTLVKKNAAADHGVPNSSTPKTILARPNSNKRPLISTAAVAASKPLFPTKNKSQTVGHQQQKLKSENKSQRSVTSNVAAVPTPLITAPELKTFKLNGDDVVCFFGRKHFLSNFFEKPLVVDGHQYFSVEHYYEAVKLFTLVGSHCAVQLKNVQDACAAKSMSRRFITEARVDRRIVEQWRRQVGIGVVKHALDLKFAPGTDLARQLIDTRAAFLAQTNPHDELWAVNLKDTDFIAWMKKNDKKDIRIPVDITPEAISFLPTVGRKGKNLLGFLLMELRGRLQSAEKSGTSMATIDEEIEEQQIDDKDDNDSVVIVNERCDEIGKRLAEMNMLQMLEKDMAEGGGI